MTKIAIQPNASGTGTFTIAAPNSNTDRTFSLPDATGEVLTSAGGTVTGNLAVSGNLTVDTNTLFVDAANNRVGIGTSSPAQSLDVNGNLRVSANSGSISHLFNFNEGGGEMSFFTSAGSAGLFLDTATVGFTASRVLHNTTTGDMQVGLAAANTTGALLFMRAGYVEAARIDASGNLLVGTTASEGPSRLSVVQTVTNQAVIGCRHTLGAGESFVRFISAANNAIIGSISNSGNTSTSYNTTSDYRLKENVVPLAGAADRLMQVPVYRFNFTADPDRTVDGFLAHEVQAYVPEAVTGTKDQVETVDVTDEDGNVTTETRPVYQGIDQSKLVPLLTAALQEALADIATLKAEVAALKGASA